MTINLETLKEMLDIQIRIESMQSDLERLAAGYAQRNGVARKNKMSASGRAAIAAAQKKRWKKSKNGSTPPRKMSAAARAKIAAAARKRWRKVKANGGNSL